MYLNANKVSELYASKFSETPCTNDRPVNRPLHKEGNAIAA